MIASGLSAAFIIIRIMEPQDSTSTLICLAMAAAAARQDMEQPAVLLSFNLQLLQAAVGLMSDAALHQTWRCLLPLARQGGLVHAAAQQHQQLWLHLLRVVPAAHRARC